MNEREYQWIDGHRADDPTALRLATHKRNDGMDYARAITQIECRQRFGSKLRETLSAFPRFEFPSVLAGEQATSDRLAHYHAMGIAKGSTVVDLTAGLGIDAFAMARQAKNVTAVELDHDRAEALAFNAAGLGIKNIEVVEGDCADFINKCIAEGRRFDTAFIDPARRDDMGSRVFSLPHCRPDVLALEDDISKICRRLVIKASPMLDISHTVNSFATKPCRVAVLGTPAECRELDIVLDFGQQPEDTLIQAVTISDEGIEIFAFTRRQEDEAPLPPLAKPLAAGDYIYEASPALMKTGAFKLVALRYGLSIFQPNTRLFYSTEEFTVFPGRRYRVVESLPYASKVIKRFRSRYPRIEVAVRNFPIGADGLRAKLGVADGGNMRVYGYTDSRGEPMLAVVEKV